MAFGQSSGPPASPKEIAALAELLERLDFGTFRQARHHLGLTQRQANGKFTRAEIAELTERLIEEHGDPDLDDMLTETRLGTEPATDSASASPPKRSAQRTRSAPIPKKRAATGPVETSEAVVYSAADEVAAARLPVGLLADELTRRGWCCIPPLDAAG